MQSYPKEDALSAIPICLLRFCYFEIFLEACQILLCHLLHCSYAQNKQKKSPLFLFICFHFPPFWFIAVSSEPVHLRDKQTQPAPCVMGKSSDRKRAPKALCAAPAEREPCVYALRRTFSGSLPTVPVLFAPVLCATKRDFLVQCILLP